MINSKELLSVSPLPDRYSGEAHYSFPCMVGPVSVTGRGLTDNN